MQQNDRLYQVQNQQSNLGAKPSITQKENLARKRSTKRQSTATSSIAIMIIAFYICWTPYAMTSIFSMLGINVTSVPSGLAILVAKLEVIVNPIIYIYFNKEVSQIRIKNL